MENTNDGESSESSIRILDKLFGSSKVDHVEISIGINNCVFGFEISVNYWIFMEILYGEHEASEVELGGCCAAYAYLWEEIEEISAFDIAEQKIDEVAVFVGLVQFYDEGAVYYLQDLFLCF